MTKENIFEKGIDIAILMCILKVVFIGKMSFEAVGFLIGLAIIWTPHAYLSKTKIAHSHSVLQSQKKIESLTSSLNLLSAKLNEVEKVAKHSSFAQGFSDNKKRFSL